MGTNCAPLVADFFLFCYERDFIMSLSDDKRADIVGAFGATSRYMDDILNVGGFCFDTMVDQVCPSGMIRKYHNHKLQTNPFRNILLNQLHKR